MLDPYKANRFVRFDAIQSLLFSIGCVIASIVWSIGVVLQGDTFFLLGFQQFVPSREKTAALARIVAGRI